MKMQDWVKLEFHGTDTNTDSDTDILANSRSVCHKPNTHHDLSADLSDTRAFPREDVC